MERDNCRRYTAFCITSKTTNVVVNANDDFAFAYALVGLLATFGWCTLTGKKHSQR